MHDGELRPMTVLSIACAFTLGLFAVLIVRVRGTSDELLGIMFGPEVVPAIVLAASSAAIVVLMDRFGE